MFTRQEFDIDWLVSGDKIQIKVIVHSLMRFEAICDVLSALYVMFTGFEQVLIRPMHSLLARAIASFTSKLALTGNWAIIFVVEGCASSLKTDLNLARSISHLKPMKLIPKNMGLQRKRKLLNRLRKKEIRHNQPT